MKSILVTGSNGQLANCIKAIQNQFTNCHITYASSSSLDITKLSDVNSFFSANNYDYCINCAAYTAVDLAEVEQEKAHLVNKIGPKNLATACHTYQTILIHVSTDFVFDGKTNIAYTENDKTNPKSIYGLSKLGGELEIEKITNRFFIIRTSWLYSEYGNNFMKTLLRVSQSRDELNVVSDQIGTPTYAIDLANVLLQIISTETNAFGIYHYSNQGVATWYDFACAIFNENSSNIVVNPIKTDDYPTLAERPKFSVLDKSKLKDSLNIFIPYWRDSLKVALRNFNAL